MSRINTNISALNTQRIMKGTNEQFARTVGRLSSGFRINRAADDAAGLGIANKMRADIRAMAQASRNAEQGNSLLQVAEGATQTIQNIVDRMKELAMQSASDNVADTERTLIQSEFTELQAEITRIVDTTKFQGGFLLKEVAESAGSAASVSSGTVSGTANDSTVTTSGTYTGAADAQVVIEYVDSTTGWQYSVDGGPATGFDPASSDPTFGGVTFDASAGGTVAADGTTWTFDLTAAVAATEASGGPRDFLVSSSGAYATSDVVTISSLDLELTTLGLDASALDTKANAQSALTAIDASITTISGVFGDIGAAQNRIDYALANNRTATENFQAAESTIRDADIAAEATELSRLQILQQAATAVLAQANQASQGVLALLR